MKYLKRFSTSERIFHIFLMLTFLIQSGTGFSGLFITTAWGKKLSSLFGGYEMASFIHKWVGILMLAGFLAHIIFIITRINRQNLTRSIFGPDSLVFNFKDLRDFRQNILWIFGLGSPPEFDRWTYWEKFDYWAVFWGMPVLGVTGLMLMFPLDTSRVLPGWSLNIAALLHRAEAVLATSYIFIVHFSIGHLRPSSFPMNEAMFSGSISIEHAHEEKPGWVGRLERQGTLEQTAANPPVFWFRFCYLIFGYSALCFGLYLLINGIYYSQYVNLH